MVSIRKAKQGFQLRNPTGQNPRRRGLGGLLQLLVADNNGRNLWWLVGGTFVGILLVMLLTGGSGGGPITITGTGTNNIINNPLRYRKPHPQLLTVDELDHPIAGHGNTNVDTGTTGNGNGNGAPPALFGTQKGQPPPPPPHRMSDTFNAMALDILETLECEKLFARTLQELKQNNNNENEAYGDGAYDGEDGGEAEEDLFQRRQRRQRRRLLGVLNQHGDDGGFTNDNNNNNINNNLVTAMAGAAEEEDDDINKKDEEDEKWGREAMGNNADPFNNPLDDNANPPGGDDDTTWNQENFGGATIITAKHLFCLAAMQDPPQEIVNELKCAASGSKRKTLLDLWTSARAQMSSDGHLLTKVLELAREQRNQVLLDRTYHLWAPNNDVGMPYMINTLNNEWKETILGLRPNLLPQQDDTDTTTTNDDVTTTQRRRRLFVDVGSCLGLTTLAVAQTYPGTKIVSVEPASPNWLLQELNVRCNSDASILHNKDITIVLAGVGPNTDDEDNMMAKLMWRPTATTSTRSWTPAEEHTSDDVELLVRLRKLRSILAEADVYLAKHHDYKNENGEGIDVLNLDCQGCEYNLIPALSEDELDAIPTIIGNVHWGYIPASKLPSSERGRTTHRRLCQHERIAKTTKECCAVADLPVKSSIPGEVLYRDNGANPPEATTVSDILPDGMCDDFDTWSKEHSLNDITEDWGWFELSSEAQ